MRNTKFFHLANVCRCSILILTVYMIEQIKVQNKNSETDKREWEKKHNTGLNAKNVVGMNVRWLETNFKQKHKTDLQNKILNQKSYHNHNRNWCFSFQIK